MTFNTEEHWDENHSKPRYTFQYSVRVDPAGKRTGYVLTAQPVTYNEDGVRSYYLDETQELRWTSEGRVATAADAEALPCERTFMVGTIASQFLAQLGPDAPDAVEGVD